MLGCLRVRNVGAITRMRDRQLGTVRNVTTLALVKIKIVNAEAMGTLKKALLICMRQKVRPKLNSYSFFPEIKWSGQCVSIVTHQTNTFNEENRPAFCINKCRDDGHPYAGVENDHWCRCCNEEDMVSAEIEVSALCNLPCPAPASDKTCGGAAYANFYAYANF